MSIFYRYKFGNCLLTNWIQVENRKEESGAIEFGDENMTMTLIFDHHELLPVPWGIVNRGDWLWKPAIFKEIGYCLSLLKSRDNDRAHSIPRWRRLQANIMKHVVIWRVFDAENVVLSSSKVYHYESEMPGDNCSVFGCGSCRRTINYVLRHKGFWTISILLPRQSNHDAVERTPSKNWAFERILEALRCFDLSPKKELLFEIRNRCVLIRSLNPDLIVLLRKELF